MNEGFKKWTILEYHRIDLQIDRFAPNTRVKMSFSIAVPNCITSRSSEASVDCLPKIDFRFVLGLNRESRPPNFSTPIARLQQIRAPRPARADSFETHRQKNPSNFSVQTRKIPRLISSKTGLVIALRCSQPFNPLDSLFFYRSLEVFLLAARYRKEFRFGERPRKIF